MIQELLKEIGLSDKEATMYVTLLRYGTQPISILAKRANFNRGTSYVILHSLLSKGLTTQSTKAKIQYFSPLQPSRLIQYLEHRERELQSQKDKVHSMMSQLIAITNPLSSTPKIQFFDGPEGARLVMEDTLNSHEKTLCSFLSIADVIDFVGLEFFSAYTTQRVRSGYTLNAIRTLEKDRKAFATDARAERYVTSKKEKREVRHASEDLAFPITMYMYDHKLAIISSKEENFALLIESKELAEMQKKLFSLLWKSLEKKSGKKRE